MYRKVIALLVHLFTASGVVLSLWSLLLIFQGESQNSLIIIFIAALIDSVDGTLARRINVKKYTPQIDGALLDNIVDYLNWTFLPVIWAYFFLDIPFWVGSVVLLSSLFGFSHTQAKTDGNFFQGFPSYWNLVVLYLFVLEFQPITSSIILLILSILVVTPIKFVYPSRVQKWQKRILILFIPYGFIIGAMLYFMDETPLFLTLISFYYPIYYVGISLLFSHSEKTGRL